MNQSSRSPWAYTDTWFLLSVLMTSKDGQSVSLKEVVACGDIINHAIFTFREFRDSITRLRNAGMLEFDGEFIRPTDEIVCKYEEMAHSVRDLGALMKRVRGTLDALPPERNPETTGNVPDPAARPLLEVDFDDFERAVHEYLKPSQKKRKPSSRSK
jgi:hypothetical protein